MTTPSVAIQGASIVLRGEFNPAILTPGWLAAQGLLGEKESTLVHNQAILNRLSIFHVSWLNCQATEDQLQLSTEEPPEFSRLRDVAAGILDVLSHTPISVMGINRHFHFQMPTYEEWHRLGDALAPKGPWDGLLSLPGTTVVEVQGVRSDGYGGFIRVNVQPSRQVKTGVYVGYNDHYVLETVERQPSTRDDFLEITQPPMVPPSSERIPLALAVLREGWDESIDAGERMAFSIAKLGVR